MSHSTADAENRGAAILGIIFTKTSEENGRADTRQIRSSTDFILSNLSKSKSLWSLESLALREMIPL